MKQKTITITTKGRGYYDITAKLNEVIAETNFDTGICHVFLQHTSASLILCENADPAVKNDLENFFQKLIPDRAELYLHATEGDDDMPAHIRTILTKSETTMPITNGQLGLGIWQNIYLWEHRYATQTRQLTITILGTG